MMVTLAAETCRWLIIYVQIFFTNVYLLVHYILHDASYSKSYIYIYIYLLSKNLKIKIYRTIILPVVLSF
jgi:hypothetical protein